MPLQWLEHVERRFRTRAGLVGVTGPYRFYDWDWKGRALIRAYDTLVAPPTHALVHHTLGIGAILYGGNFAVRRKALARIGGFDCRIEFHGEDTNLGRRLTPHGPVEVRADCWVWTCLDTNPFCSAISTSIRNGATGACRSVRWLIYTAAPDDST